MFAAVDRVGVDFEQGQQSGDGGEDPIPQGVAVVEDRIAGGVKRFEDRDGEAGAAARGVDGHVDGVSEPGDAVGVLLPVGEAFLPEVRGCAGVFIGCLSLADGFAFFDPGTEVGGFQIGKIAMPQLIGFFRQQR